MASRLKRRISQAGQSGASRLAVGVLPQTPMEMPIALVSYSPTQPFPWGGSVTLTYEDLHPMWTADGAVIAARVPGPWGVVYPAGRM